MIEKIIISKGLEYAGWTEGADTGYNAVNPRSVYLDDTYWNNTDEINDVVDE